MPLLWYGSVFIRQLEKCKPPRWERNASDNAGSRLSHRHWKSAILGGAGDSNRKSFTRQHSHLQRKTHMYSFLRLRSQYLIANFPNNPLLDDEMLALDPRRFESTASSPSLRATENDYLRTFGIMSGPQPTADQDSANVKVVVRVRQFVPRGKLITKDELF